MTYTFESLILLKRFETLAFPVDLFHGIIFLKSTRYITILNNIVLKNLLLRNNVLFS